MEITLVKELVSIFGPVGTIAILGFWWFVNHKEKVHQNGDVKERDKVRQAIITMDSNVSHLMGDVDEIKGDVKSVQSTVTEHLRDHSNLERR